MERFFRQWKDALQDGPAVAVATVVNGLGSRPRKNGAQMLVKPSGQIVDTVGGGRLEADVIACARQVLRGQASLLHHFDLTGQDAYQTDMICGGAGDVLVYYSGRQDSPVLEKMLEPPELDGWLCYPVDTGEGLFFMPKEGSPLGRPELMEEAQCWDKQQELFLFQKEGRRYLAQWLKSPGKLHIMGAGHVSLEIAKIAHLAGMDCVVHDDRVEFVNRERFPDARCVLLEDMAIPPTIELGSKDMVAIVTRGHIWDMENLAWALNTGAGYIGMIGSRRKSGMIFDALLQQGFSKDRIRQVHAPIGLDIGAQTPQEIAVAIVAELIAFRHGKLI